MTALIGRDQLEEQIRRLSNNNEHLRRALRGVAVEVLQLANAWRSKYPDSSEERQQEISEVGGDVMTAEDFVREQVYTTCAEQLEALGAVRLDQLVRGDELVANRRQAWKVAEQRLPVMHPVKACVWNALLNLENAAREQDGTEHPAIWQLTEACKWMLTAIESSNDKE